MRSPAMDEPHNCNDHERFNWQGNEGVGNTAMVLERSDGAA
jgi:hypothetical protein